MTIQTIALRDDAHWRELRAKHLGGSEIAALFDEHPQITRYELWQRKARRIPEPDLSDNERVFWGQCLEPAIAEGVARKTGWQIRKVHRYYSNPEIGLGGSLDYEVRAHERGPAVLEIKTADWLIAKGWEDGPPLSYQLQVMAYLALTGRAWGAMAVLVGGNDLRIFEYQSRPGTIAIIEQAVVEFWRSIREGHEPKADFTQDGETIRRLYASAAAGKTIDLTGSNRSSTLIADYVRGRDMEKEGAAIKDAAKAELLPLIGDAERATCGLATISAKMIGAKHIEYDRAAYRDFRVNVKEPKV